MKKEPFQHESANESPGFLLYRLTLVWQERLNRVFDSFEINQTRYAILASLLYFEERGESLTQQGLANHAKIEKMTLSKSIRQLEERGLIRRTESPGDTRANQVKLTPEGRKLARKMVVAVEGADEEFFARLTPEQQRSFQEVALSLIE